MSSDIWQALVTAMADGRSWSEAELAYEVRRTHPRADSRHVTAVLAARGDLFVRRDSLWQLRRGVSAVLSSSANAGRGGSRNQALPGSLDLYRWQHLAIQAWITAGESGIVEAVTGTGKTHVGLAALLAALQARAKATVLVPSVILQEQWVDRIHEFLPQARVSTMGGGSLPGCRPHSPNGDIVVAVVNSATSSDITLASRQNTWLIADEVHRYGARTFRAALRPGYRKRLGLTATLERCDDEVDNSLKPYFGGVVFSYDYSQAVPDGCVAPYELTFVGVHLSRDDRRTHDRSVNEIDRLRRVLTDSGAPSDNFETWARRTARGRSEVAPYAHAYAAQLDIRRDLLEEARAKDSAIRAIRLQIAGARAGLFFTQSIARCKSVASVVASMGVPAAAISSQLPDSDRRLLLNELRQGVVKALCAPKLLDEGVDVPEVDLGVILSASRQRRQMIQRLGRVIRKKPDGRSAQFVIVYCIDTVEDPCEGRHHGFLDLAADYARHVSNYEVLRGALVSRPLLLGAEPPPRPAVVSAAQQVRPVDRIAETRLDELNRLLDSLDRRCDWLEGLLDGARATAA